MSIANLMRDGVGSRVAATPTVLRGTTTPSTDARDAATGLIADLARYIPSEALALYLAGLSFVVDAQDDTYTGRFILAGAVLVVALLYAAGLHRNASRQAGRPFRWPSKRMLIVAIAFAGWVMVIPESPFETFGFYSADAGAAIGLGANVAINVFVLFFGPPEEP